MTNFAIHFNFNRDGVIWYEDENLVFKTKAEAGARLRKMGDELNGDAEILWATDCDGDPVLIANAEHWTLVARYAPEDEI